MNNLSENILKTLNDIGRAFCNFSLTMLVQSSVLIVLLFIIDIIIRKRVRATFRYCIWMLVFIKLILPPALSLPTGIGNWFGEYFVVNTADFDRKSDNITKQKTEPVQSVKIENTEFVPQQIPQLQNDNRPFVPQAASKSEISPQLPTNLSPEGTTINETADSISNPLTWQGGIFLIWLVGILVLSVVLVQRVFFVKGLIAQSEPVKNRLLETLQDCSKQLGIRRNLQMKLSYNASSPAVCGLFNPVILIPRGLLEKISHEKFSAILIHELSHIKRADLWVNCMQTILQIFYFYNPLVWLANSIVRGIREQAVDEMVLVALGAEAKSYSNTLIDVAEMAFSRPTLSLRLVGVVESKKALSERIKHILSRPIPKSAKLGLLGLIVIIIVAAILLPMAKSDAFGNWFSRDVLIKFSPSDTPIQLLPQTGNSVTDGKNYKVRFKKDEKLAIVAELYQAGKPMRNLGCKIFSGSQQLHELSVVLNKKFLNKEQTDIKYDLRVTLGEQDFKLNDILVHTPVWFNGINLNFFSGSSIPPAKIFKGQQYIEFENLISERTFPDDRRDNSPRIWIPGYVTDIPGETYCILVKMLPLSQLERLQVTAPIIDEKIQLPDGTYLQPNASIEERKSVEDDYLRNLKEKLLSSQMPLPKLTAHQYYKVGETVSIKAELVNSGQWKPTLDDLDKSGNLCFYLIDGQEYDSRLGFGPFNTGGMNLNIPGDLYINLILPAGKHTVAFGWRDVDVINPEEPKKTVHFNRLTTEPVEFEVVREIPDDYYSEVYEDGWEDILASNIGTIFTDDIRKLDVAGTLLTLCVKPLPFEIAFDVYAQAEGSEEREYVGQVARKANPGGNYIMACDHKIKSLDWDNAGQKRYRLILIPSEKVAIANPPIHNYYNREYITDWATFEKSEDFEQNYQTNLKRKEVNKIPRYGGTIKNDKPVDLDRLGRRWNGDSNENQPPEGFELGWSSEKGGILKINPTSNVRMLWFPEANASRIDPDAKTKAMLVELPESKTIEINPPKGERTLITVRSNESKVYFVQVSKVNEQWANLSWWQHEEPQSKNFKATLPNGGTIELVGVCKKSQPDQPWYSPDGKQKLNSSDEIFSHLGGSSGIVNAAGTQTYEFFVHCDMPTNKINKVVKNEWNFQPVQGIPGSFRSLFSSGQHYFTASSAFPETLEKLNLTFEVSNGQWKTIAESDGKNEKEISITHRGQKQNITLGKIEEKDGSLFIEVKHKIKEMATGIVVIDKYGKVWHPVENKYEPNGDFIKTVCKFDGITKVGIDLYEFQIQPIDIVTFKEISLKNDLYTNPAISVTPLTDEIPISARVEAAFMGPEFGQYAVSLPDGVTVELLGLCKESVEGTKWWKPNGEEMPEPAFEASTRTPPMGDIPTRYTFLAKAQGGEDISMKAKIYEGFGNLTKVAQDGSVLCFVKYPDNSKPQHEDAFEKGPIEIGIAQGQWIMGRGAIGEPLHIPREYLIGNKDEIVIQPPRADNAEPNMVTNIWASVTSYDYEFKLVCKLKDGSTRESEQAYFQSANIIETGGLHNSAINTFPFVFDRLTYDQIVDYELFYRKFEYVRFNNVAFKPDIKTNVEIVSQNNSAAEKADKNQNVMNETNIPAEMTGTWFFDNPMGDDEQMAIFPDGKVVVLYSNGHKDQTNYENGIIELAEYDNAKYKLSIQENGTLIEYIDSQESGLAKIWRRIDTQPQTELIKSLIGTGDLKTDVNNEKNRQHIFLEFRVAPDSVESSRNPSPLKPEEELKYKEDLQQNGPDAGKKRNDEYIWIPIREGTEVSFLISEDYKDSKYLLVCNKKPFVLLPDEVWEIENISTISDSRGLPAISVEIDEKGGELFYKLTSGNINRSLAIIIGDKVTSIPVIRSPLRNKLMITGSFTKEELQNMSQTTQPSP